MYKASKKAIQIDIFTTAGNLFKGKTLKQYENKMAWHNQFRNNVTMQIDEDLFKVLYDSKNGSPNASIRVLVAMMILKEADGMSDERLFESCRFNMLTRSALGLINAEDSIPTESTYYLFRKKVSDYAKQENGENLFNTVFSSITKKQALEFNVSGKQIRMDSKLMGSNIAWLSRYELVHETIRVFYKGYKTNNSLSEELQNTLDNLLKIKGNKVVYTNTNDELKSKLHKLGELMYALLNLTSYEDTESRNVFSRVFNEQFEVGENKLVVARKKEEISAKSIQSPHDPDSHYRNKDGNQVKGYSINITESCDDEGLNLISDANVKQVSTSDVDFLQEGVVKSEDIFQNKAESIHADGAYHSPENQEFCTNKEAKLYLHAIQGAKGRYKLDVSENGEVIVFDTHTEKLIESVRIYGKNNIEKWRITTEKGLRYFSEKDIKISQLRTKIENTPIEILQKRNNVEATIFQLGYHYSNSKTRYRGLIKHEMWANIRCLWVNFVRVLNFQGKMAINLINLSLLLFLGPFLTLFFDFKTILELKNVN